MGVETRFDSLAPAETGVSRGLGNQGAGEPVEDVPGVLPRASLLGHTETW